MSGIIPVELNDVAPLHQLHLQHQCDFGGFSRPVTNFKTAQLVGLVSVGLFVFGLGAVVLEDVTSEAVGSVDVGSVAVESEIVSLAVPVPEGARFDLPLTIPTRPC